MIISSSYRKPLLLAIGLHMLLLSFFLIDKSTERPVVESSKMNNKAQKAIVKNEQQQEKAIKAVAVDSKEVIQEINRLNDIKARKKQADLDIQRKLNQQAELSRKKILEEQKKVELLKREAAKLALAKQKQLAEDKKLKKEMEARKIQQEKELVKLKAKQLEIEKQQELEVKKIAEIKNKKLEELAKIERAKEQQIQAELAKKQQEKIDREAAQNAAEKAKMAGVIDKYKALIINAISQQWILPENANSRMSSEFRIRLAPNGAVLQVSLIRSSGDGILDRSAQAAIYKASPLPVPTEPSAFNLFRDISLTVRPGNARG